MKGQAMSTITTAPSVVEGTWTLDTVHSKIGFSVVYMGVAPFETTFTEVAATLDPKGLRGTAKASSIDVSDENFVAHLASPDFFDTANYPEISFEAGSFEPNGSDVTVEGELEVKGKRTPVTLSGTITGPVEDPYGNSKLGVKLEGTLDRNEVGLGWNAQLPGGGQILGDEITLTASLIFVGAKEA
jgi:polyisoprenoid-binding protein YceI